MEEASPDDEKGLRQHETESQSEQIAAQSSDLPTSGAAAPPIAGGHIARVPSHTPEQTEEIRRRVAPHNDQPVPKVHRTHGRALPR